MSAVDEVRLILNNLKSQGMTVHNLGDEVWDVCEQMAAAAAAGGGGMSADEPSYEARDQLRVMLSERGVMLPETSEVEGAPWVLMSPELMMQFILDKEQAEAELSAMDKRRATAYGMLDSAEAELDALKARIAACEETNRQLEAQVKSVSNCYGYDHAHMAGRIAELEAKNKRLRNNWESESEARKDDIQRAEEVEAELAALHQKAAADREYMDSAEKRIAALEAALTDAAIAALESENASLKALNEWLGTMNSTLLDLRESVVLEEHARAEQAEAERDKWHERFQTCLVGGMKEIEARQQAEAELAELEAENAGLRSHQACTKRAEQAEAELDALKDGISRRIEREVAEDTRELHSEVERLKWMLDEAHSQLSPMLEANDLTRRDPSQWKDNLERRWAEREAKP